MTGLAGRRPALDLLAAAGIERILDEALAVLRDPGVRVADPEARALLAGVGAIVRDGVARIPESAVRAALATVPRSFTLHARDGAPAVRYGAGEVAFDPGSCGVAVLDPATREHRPSTAETSSGSWRSRSARSDPRSTTGDGRCCSSRNRRRVWQQGGAEDMFARARARVDALLARSASSSLDPAVAGELVGRVADALRAVGFDGLPGVAAETAAAVARR